MPHHTESWRARTERQDYTPPANDTEQQRQRRAFCRPQTSLGGAAFYRQHRSHGIAGHLVYTAGALAPLVIGELVEDVDKRWRLMRLVSVGTALAYETLHVVREERRRKEQEARLAECRDRCHE
jgi:hypothetical protein